jgi:hypothetical protein
MTPQSSPNTDRCQKVENDTAIIILEHSVSVRLSRTLTCFNELQYYVLSGCYLENTFKMDLQELGRRGLAWTGLIWLRLGIDGRLL